jgi:hypothetical protein
MEEINTLVSKNIDSNSDPRFAGFVANALNLLSNKQPEATLESLIPEALDMAYEYWDMYLESQYYIAQF